MSFVCAVYAVYGNGGLSPYGTSAGLVGLRRRSSRRELLELGLSLVLRVRAAALAARYRVKFSGGCGVLLDNIFYALWRDDNIQEGKEQTEDDGISGAGRSYL